MMQDGDTCDSSSSSGNRAAYRLRHTHDTDPLLEDICIIYEAPAYAAGEQASYPPGEPASFLAHSIKTDQIGSGNTPMEAYVDLLRMLIQLVGRARSYPGNTEILRRAPKEIREMFADSIEVRDSFRQQAFEQAMSVPAKAGRVAPVEREPSIATFDLPIGADADPSQKSDSWYSITKIDGATAKFFVILCCYFCNNVHGLYFDGMQE